MFAGINSIIGALRNPGGATLVRHSRSEPINGRFANPISECVQILDIVHQPQSTNKTSRDAGNSSDERINIWLRTELLTTVQDENDAWFIVINGKTYSIESVVDWQAGKYWEGTGVRINDVSTVFFTLLTSAQTLDPSMGMRLEYIKRGYSASSLNRNFRFTMNNSNSYPAVGVAYKDALDSVSDAVQFMAINATGATEILTPTSTVLVNKHRVAILPKVLSPNGTIQYEVL